MCAITLLKVLKGASLNAGYKYSILVSLAAVTASVGNTFEDQLNRDLWRAAKSHATDRSGKVVAAAFDLFRSLVTHRAHFKHATDYETLKSIVQKALDSPFAIARQSAAKCFAACLVLLSSNTNDSPHQPKDTNEKNQHTPPSTSPPPPKHKLHFLLSLRETLLSLASIYTHESATTRVRVGVTQILAMFIMDAHPLLMKHKANEISKIILVEVLSNETIANHKHKSILARQHARFIITNVFAQQILSERGQLSLLESLTSDILKSYPLENHPKESLVATLECVASLLSLVSSAASHLSESLKQILLQLLVHPSYSVQVATCVCFQKLIGFAPHLIIPLLTNSLATIQKTMALIPAKKSQPYQVTGHAMLVSLLNSVTHENPLYSSIDLASRVLSTATSLLKEPTNSDEITLALHAQISWTLVSGVMSLGPTFVKVHLSQLLLLWKNAIPKVFAKDRYSDKTTLQLCYIYHVRTCTLGSITAFLANNSRLVTSDAARRIIQLLQNATMFANAVPENSLLDNDPSHQLDSSLTLQNYDHMLRRRILQSYIYLSQYTHLLTAFPATLLQSALATFADPAQPGSCTTSPADSIWHVADNFAYGVTTNVQSFDIIDLQHEQHIDKLKRVNPAREPLKDVEEFHWLSECDWLDELEKAITTPVLCANEQDADTLFHKTKDNKLFAGPIPAATAVVNLSIELFAALFPLQSASIQESLLTQLSTFLYSSSSSSKSERLGAIFVNASVALYSVLKYSFTANTKEHIKSPKVLNHIIKLLKPIVGSVDPVVRNVAAQALGMTCAVAGSAAAAEVIEYLIDEIVKNRDPDSRAGCSASLGYVLKHMGGRFAGLHLKTVVGILTSLASDPHPTVHFWALEAIAITVSSVGLSFSSHALSTLNELNGLYFQESHGDEMLSHASSNLEIRFPTYRIIARCVHALIDVLGPDLQESSTTQTLVYSMVQQFLLTNDYICVAESIRCSQELIIFAPDLIDFSMFVQPLTTYLLISYQTPIKSAAIDSLYQLIRTSSTTLFKYCGDRLKHDIWLVYDMDPSNQLIHDFITRWAEQTTETESLEWVSRVYTIFFMSLKDFHFKDIKNTLSEEKDDALVTDESDEPLKWQTKVLAVQVLKHILRANFKNKPIEDTKQNKVLTKTSDIIKIVCSSATAPVSELRLLGVELLNEILLFLQDIPDPVTTKVALLEQYQVQISGALTMAFSRDTSPELAAKAINVCATFIGIGVIEDVERMGRVLLILVKSLESCVEKEIQLGDLKSLGPNAQVMLKMAVLSAWANLQVASASKSYLQPVVSPFIPMLVPLWLSSLKEFAELRTEPESSCSPSKRFGGSIDHMYSALSRNSTLFFYQTSWLQLLDAIAMVIEQDPDEVFKLFVKSEEPSKVDIEYGSEAAAFFFVLYGLLVESLVRPQSTMGSAENIPEQRTKILVSLKRILHPSICGTVVYKDMIFVETIDILDRLVLIGSVAEQCLVVDIAYRLCVNRPDTKDAAKTHKTDQLFELVRVVMVLLTNQLPFLDDFPVSASAISNLANPVYALLVKSALNSLVGMVQVFPEPERIDLYACLLFVFGKIFGNTAVIRDSVPKSVLPMFKLLVTNMVEARNGSSNQQHTSSIDECISVVTTQIALFLKGLSTPASASELAQMGVDLDVLNIIFETCAPVLKLQTTTSPGIGSRVVVDTPKALVELLQVAATQQAATDCLKTVLCTSHDSPVGQAFVVETVPALVSLVSRAASSQAAQQFGNEADTNPCTETVPRADTNPCDSTLSERATDLLVDFSKSLDPATEPARLHALFSITVKLLAWYGNGAGARREYVGTRLAALSAHSPDGFGKVVEQDLSKDQRETVQWVMGKVADPGKDEPLKLCQNGDEAVDLSQDTIKDEHPSSTVQDAVQDSEPLKLDHAVHEESDTPVPDHIANEDSVFPKSKQAEQAVSDEPISSQDTPNETIE